MVVNSAGWTTSMRSSGGASGSARSTASTDQSTYRASASAQASAWARKCGDASSRAAAISLHCEP